MAGDGVMKRRYLYYAREQFLLFLRNVGRVHFHVDSTHEPASYPMGHVFTYKRALLLSFFRLWYTLTKRLRKPLQRIP